MTDFKVYVEGGGHKDLDVRCREGFQKLMEHCRIENRPRFIPKGGRQQTFESFRDEHLHGRTRYVAMLIDSEAPVDDVEETWAHIETRPGDEKMERPDGASDDQVLFMTTCMETWLLADRDALCRIYARDNPRLLKTKHIPGAEGLESRGRHDVLGDLVRATSTCKKAYAKDERSYQMIGELDPDKLCALPSFARFMRIIKQKTK